MKTKIFSAWTSLVEQLLKDISTETVSYNDLSAWMDKEGPKLFEGGQAKYFAQHKDEYLHNLSGDFFNYQPAAKQIEVGFDAVFKQLLQRFPSLEERSTEKFDNFKKACIRKPFHSLIAIRAIITAQVIENNESDRLKNCDFVIELYQSIEAQVKASRESLEAHRANIPRDVPRGSSSPVMHKNPQVITTPSSDTNVVEEKRFVANK